MSASSNAWRSACVMAGLSARCRAAETSRDSVRGRAWAAAAVVVVWDSRGAGRLKGPSVVVASSAAGAEEGGAAAGASASGAAVGDDKGGSSGATTPPAAARRRARSSSIARRLAKGT